MGQTYDQFPMGDLPRNMDGTVAAAPSPVGTLVERELAHSIMTAWIQDERFPQWGPPAFYAELAAKVAAATLEAQAREIAATKAESVRRGKMLTRFRDVLHNVTDTIEDEGDRAYFGSTNDVETIKEISSVLEDFHWELILAEKDEPDVYETLREQRTRAEAAESRLSSLRNEVVEECRTKALLQRCERGTPWDLACVAIANAIASLASEKMRLTEGPVVYLREHDAGTDNACWVVCANGDHGAVRFQAALRSLSTPMVDERGSDTGAGKPDSPCATGAAAQSWQPIERAPKDGTRILASINGDVNVTFWLEQTKAWWNGYTGHALQEDSQPTHWQPLPAPPADHSLTGQK